MDNKFSNMDISKFDPTNASVDSVRKWLFAIIDAELDKDPEERDYDLIEECSECERELPTEGAGMSEKELAVGLERIKAQVSETEGKDIKIIKTKKKSKKSVRVIVILAAAISVMLLSVTAMAISQGKSVGKFISENIQKIFNMDASEQIEEGGITLIKNGERLQYSSIEEVTTAMGYNILYPSYLPQGVNVEEIILTNTDDNDKTIISFVTNDIRLSFRITIGDDSTFDYQTSSELYKISFCDCYVIKKEGSIQAIFYYKENKYDIKCNNYDELIKILDELKEIEK